MIIDKTMRYIILIHIFVCYLFYNLKPDFMFQKNGRFKSFGTGRNKTVFPFWLTTSSITLLIYINFKLKKGKFVRY